MSNPITKVIAQHGLGLSLVRLDKPVYGGYYAVINGDRMKDGLCLDAANEIFITLKKLSK